MSAAEPKQVMEADLVETLIAALDGDSPEACLDAAVSALKSRGLAEPAATGETWLELRRGERALRLVAAPGAELPGPRARALLEHLLGAALARAVERAEARKVSERLDLLQGASFEGILVHDQGVALDCNERLCEMIGYTRAEVLEPGHMVRVVAPEELAQAQERIRQRIEGEFLVTC